MPGEIVSLLDATLRSNLLKNWDILDQAYQTLTEFLQGFRTHAHGAHIHAYTHTHTHTEREERERDIYTVYKLYTHSAHNTGPCASNQELLSKTSLIMLISASVTKPFAALRKQPHILYLIKERSLLLWLMVGG